MAAVFRLAALGIKSVKDISLKKIFGLGASSVVTFAPEKTGEFIGSRVIKLFNGLSSGIGRGLLENPVLIATGLTALAAVGINQLSR